VGEGWSEVGRGLLCQFDGLATVRVDMCGGRRVEDSICKADAKEFVEEGSGSTGF
jgi:hypothetical protein